MRTRVSGKKRLITVIISSIICLAMIIYIIVKMSSLTRNLLNNDDIRANVDCVSIAAFSDASVFEVLKENAPHIELSEEALKETEKNKDKLCVVNLRYSFYNNTGKEISDFSMSVNSIKGKSGRIYAFSPIRQETRNNKAYTFTQSIVAQKKDVDEKYFTSALPLGFEANYSYEFSYSKEGQSGKKLLKFTTVRREEEVDEYEKLFEKQSESDGEDAQN